jgi:hypothetical protein
MPLFRFHRGGLSESLKTTVVVNNIDQLAIVIANSFDLAMLDKKNWNAEIKIEPYPSKDDNFDARIGWYTHLVTCNIYEADKMHPVGYLSEPFN